MLKWLTDARHGCSTIGGTAATASPAYWQAVRSADIVMPFALGLVAHYNVPICRSSKNVF
jgi:hypothetical protein